MIIMISQNDLIKKYQGKKTFFHLARTPITSNSRPIISAHRQLYAWGFNTGGRPEGFWFAFGSSWLAMTVQLDNPQYPTCCYLYEVKLRPRTKILHIRNDRDFREFDRKWPSYWLNFDYFELSFIDYLTGMPVRTQRKKELIFESLPKKPGQTFKEILLANKVIFETAKEAERHCDFYKSVVIPVERFKYKDWAAVAEHYSGVAFWNYDRSNPLLMNYFWFQTLDAPSGCIWDTLAVQSTKLMYIKRDINNWEKV